MLWKSSTYTILPGMREEVNQKSLLFHGYHISHEWTFEQTDDMWLGECVHGVALEERQLLTPPPEVLTSNGKRRGKAWEAWSDVHSCDLVLLEKDAKRVRAMVHGMMIDGKIRALLESEGEPEVSLFWTDDETQLPLRARLDKPCLFDGSLVIADLKCTNIDPADERDVAAKVAGFGYAQQAAFYLDGIKATTGIDAAGFCFIFVRNRPPYNAVLWRLEDNAIDAGRRRNRAALFDLRERLATNNWTGPRFNRENYLFMPKWWYDGGDNAMPSIAPLAEFADFQTDQLTGESLS